MMIRIRSLDFSLTPPIWQRVESRIKSAVEPVGDRVIVVTARLRCSNCYAKDCDIQVDRLLPQRNVPKRLL